MLFMEKRKRGRPPKARKEENSAPLISVKDSAEMSPVEKLQAAERLIREVTSWMYPYRGDSQVARMAMVLLRDVAGDGGTLPNVIELLSAWDESRYLHDESIRLQSN
jgi:hypothetical protein